MNLAISPATHIAATNDAGNAAAVQHRKLVDAAQRFEAMLLQEMLKPMKEHGFAQEEAEAGEAKESGSSFADTLSSFGSETLAAAIAKSGGLGIAKRVVQQVESERAARSRTATSTS